MYNLIDTVLDITVDVSIAAFIVYAVASLYFAFI